MPNSHLLFPFGFLWCCRKKRERKKYIFIKNMVLIPVHQGCAKTVCLINCNYFMYSSILLSMCPLPKLARVSEFHLTLILWQLQNYDGNKYMYYEKNKVVIPHDSNSLSLINNKMPLYILMLKSSIIWCRQQISQRAKTWKTFGSTLRSTLLCWQ